MEIDVLIIKKETDEPIRKNIGRIFRKYNIVEYKSPKDYLSVDDFYKVYGYTCFYKADTGCEGEIPIDELTITLVSETYPRKLIRHLKEEREYQVEKIEDGIYYVIGDQIPIQILVTGRLSPEKNLWLHSLTNSLKSRKVTRMLLEDYGEHKHDKLYSSVMQIIVKANEARFKEENKMCDALLEIMKEELDESRAEGERLGRAEGERLGRAEGERLGRAEGERDGEMRITELVLKLSESGRSDEIVKAASDEGYRKKLLKEFGL